MAPFFPGGTTMRDYFSGATDRLWRRSGRHGCSSNTATTVAPRQATGCLGSIAHMQQKQSPAVACSAEESNAIHHHVFAVCINLVFSNSEFTQSAFGSALKAWVTINAVAITEAQRRRPHPAAPLFGASEACRHPANEQPDHRSMMMTNHHTGKKWGMS